MALRKQLRLVVYCFSLGLPLGQLSKIMTERLCLALSKTLNVRIETMSRLVNKLILLPSLALVGCAAATAETDTRVASAPDIPYSHEDTCQTQKYIEAYHSWRDSILKKRRIVYVPDCAKKATS